MKVPYFLRLIAGICCSVCFIAFWGWMIYDPLVNGPVAAAAQPGLEREFELLDPLPDCCRDTYQAGHKTNVVWVRGDFSTDRSFEEIWRYYDTKLTAGGWKFHRKKDLRDWGRDLGGKSVEYCKGEYTATIEYAGKNDNGRFDCGVSLEWGGGSLNDWWSGDYCK